MHREFGIINSYTLEVSFCGSSQGMYKDAHFSQKLLKVSNPTCLTTLKEMGHAFCKTLATFTDAKQCKEAQKEAENIMSNNAAIVLNPLTKAANAGSLAMQMQFDPSENKHGVSSLSNPIALVINSK